VGLYGRRSDPLEISNADGALRRDGAEVYPIDGGRYYMPNSGFVMWFRRGADGSVDALVTDRGDGRETVLPRIR
jgi:hypothetical protein